MCAWGQRMCGGGGTGRQSRGRVSLGSKGQWGRSPASCGEWRGRPGRQRVQVTVGFVGHCRGLDFSRERRSLEGFKEGRGLHFVGSFCPLVVIPGVKSTEEATASIPEVAAEVRGRLRAAGFAMTWTWGAPQ